MKCMNCGADIPEGMLICPDCFTEVQMVPDYNPLDDVLAREVKGSVSSVTRPIRSDDMERYRSIENTNGSNSTRVLRQEEVERLRAERMRRIEREQQNYIKAENARKNTGGMKRETSNSQRMPGPSRRTTGEMRRAASQPNRTTGEMRHTTGSARKTTAKIRQSTGEMRRESPKKRAAKKLRRRVLLSLLLVFLAIGGIIFFFYQNSYEGVLAQGQRALNAGQYSAAEKYFNRAVSKDRKRADAYVGLSKVYIQQNNIDSAENIFLNAIAVQPDNTDLYEAAIHFYLDTDQADEISGLLYECDDEILSADEISPYVSKMPEFSLKEETYSEVQELSLSSNGTIYYTDDGSEPTETSTPYTEPILLNEGTTIIKAIAVNKEGIVSLVSSMSYTIEIPVADAPAVTPSTGQYQTPTQITVRVPEGYTAYYTLDGSDPSADNPSAQIYMGPVDMPIGQTIFSVVLINNAGKATQITKRNYTLEYQQ